MDTKALRQKILDLAIRGKLVPQDPNDEPASVLLERIREEKKKMVEEGKLKPKDIKKDTIIFKGEDNLHYEKFQDGTVKCIEDEIPFEVPDGWEWSRMSEIIELYSGQDLTPDRYNDCKEGIPYITGASNLENGKVIINRWTTFPATHAQMGDLLLIVKGSGVGKMAFLDIEDVHIARQIMALRCHEGISNKYLGIVVSALIVNITSQANGIIPGIRREVVLNTLVPIPPVNEQYKIGVKVKELLNTISLIEKDKNEIIDIISTTKSKILDLAIHGKLVSQDPTDEPASVLLERIRAEKEELIKQGKIKRDKKESIIFHGDDNSYYEKIGSKVEKIDNKIPFELPEGWAWCRFSEVIELFSGQDLTPDRYSDIPQGIPYITGASNLENGCVIVNRWTSSATTHTTIGDLLLTVKGSGIGKMAICNIEDAHIARQIMALRCRNGIRQEYLRIVVSTFLTEITNQANGIIPGIRREVVLGTLFPLPPSSEQLKISAEVNCIIGKLQMIEKGLSGSMKVFL